MLRRVLLAAGLLAVFGVLGVAANTRSVRVSNGVNEAVVSGATVSAWSQSVATDASGVATFSGLSSSDVSGTVSVSVSATGFISFSRDLDATDSTLFVSLSPVLDAAANNFRAILSWGLTPRDLDSHARGPTGFGTTYHTYFSRKTNGLSGGGVVSLDVDDTSSYGPETITFEELQDGWHAYYVHQWSGDGSLVASKGVLDFYSSTSTSGPVKSFTASSASGSTSTRYWHVLDLHVETTGGVQTVTMYEVNRFVSSEPSGALQDTGLPSLAVYSSAGGGGGGGGGGGDPNCGVVPSPTPAPSVEAGYCPLNTPESSLSMVLASPPTAVTANLDTTLQDIAENYLGVSHLANVYAEEDLRTITTDFTSRAQDLADILSERLLSKATAVRNIRQAVASNSAGSSSYTSCCDAPSSTTTSPRTGSLAINLDTPCGRLPSTADADSAEVLQSWRDTDGLDGEFIDEFNQDEGIAFVYYGTGTGNYRIYPRVHQTQCGNYDPRIRPWYVLASTPEPKDVIIILDTSASMTTSDRISKAREAAKAVLSTLSPRDFVTVVTFSDTASLPETDAEGYDLPSCLATNLAPVTPYITGVLDKYIDDFVCSFGSTNMGAALEEAFEAYALLNNTRSASEVRELSVLLLSDGAPTDSKSGIATILEQYRHPQTHLFTYALGSDLSASDKQYLSELAAENNGEYTEVPDDGDIVTAMASFYSFYSRTQWTGKDDTDVQFTVPYVDASGAGLVVTAALPVFDASGAVEGVVGVDVSMASALEGIQALDVTSASYVFAVDQDNRVFFHPNLADPGAWDIDPTFKTLEALEKTTSIATLKAGLSSGTAGNLAAEVYLSVPLGDEDNEVTKTVQTAVHYYWSPVEGTPFVVCVAVLNSEESLQDPNTATVGPSTEVLYHRVDLEAASQLPEEACRQPSNGVVSVQNRTSFRYASRSFDSPTLYLGSIEEHRCSSAYAAHMETSAALPAGCPVPDAVSVRDVRIAGRMDAFWRTQTLASSWVLFRYVGTPQGVWTVSPATPTFKSYDPVDRPWYKAAEAHAGSYTVGSPYVDASTQELVMTLSEAVMIPERSTPMAVMGIDFSIAQFGELLRRATFDAYSVDSETESELLTVVINAAGHIVYHPDMEKESVVEDLQSSGESLSNVFLGEWEPHIADWLIQESFLQSQFCVDHNSGNPLRREVWAVSQSITTGQRYTQAGVVLTAAPFADGSLWLLVTTSTTSSCALTRTDSVCDCRVRGDGQCLDCSSARPRCFCPCSCPSDIDPCLNTGSDDDVAVPVCPATVTTAGTASIDPVRANTLSSPACTTSAVSLTVTFAGVEFTSLSASDKAQLKFKFVEDVADMHPQLTTNDVAVTNMRAGSMIVDAEIFTSDSAVQESINSAVANGAGSFPSTVAAVPTYACTTASCTITASSSGATLVDGDDSGSGGSSGAVIGVGVAVVVVVAIAAVTCFCYKKQHSKSKTPKPVTSTVNAPAPASAPAPAPAQPQVYGPGMYGQQPPVGAPYGQQPPVGAPYGQQPPAGAPYGQQPPSAPYGQQPPAGAPYGQQPPSAPYGQPAAPQPYAQPASNPYGQPYAQAYPAAPNPYAQAQDPAPAPAPAPAPGKPDAPPAYVV